MRTDPNDLEGMSRPCVNHCSAVVGSRQPLSLMRLLPPLCSQIPQNPYLNRHCITVLGDACVCTHKLSSWQGYRLLEFWGQFSFIFDAPMAPTRCWETIGVQKYLSIDCASPCFQIKTKSKWVKAEL